ncbi:Thiamine-monophosphate kinase [Methanimicrococcus sp. At1]|uniref:Thiamine-monophosphate kinase n=1 Tax=Methanimicrococcus hacksteinii TaxID=3028293 RepID=A0ABU3VNX2_9EURY|nr:thiamine-phosphate kinase [Methanimicrococcus sp. At1]MDV0445093.1 Thiamine-monophosphate kinase [Methanimicrococcus sp. At1]
MSGKPIPNTEDPDALDAEILSEKDFIHLFSQIFQFKNKPLLSGSEFDDCAALRLDSFCKDLPLQSLTFSTDTVRESSDFPAGMTFWQKGWMAAAVNLSDLAAMGSDPVAFLASFGLPKTISLNDAGALAQGIQDCVSFFGAEVIGGDTESNDELTITGTVIGISENKNLILRKNVKFGDLLCVTGLTGSAGVALSILLGKIRAENVSDAFLKNLTEPFPRIFEGKMLAKSGAVNSMIDTSDGLASSVYELSALSGVFFEIDEQSLPFDEEALEIIFLHLKNKCEQNKHDQNENENDKIGLNGNDAAFAAEARAILAHEALYTGGDYELLFTIPPDKLLIVEKLFETFNSSTVADTADRFNGLSSAGKSGRFPCKFTVIGKTIAEKENVVLRHTESGQVRQPLLKMGYDSFKKYI